MIDLNIVRAAIGARTGTPKRQMGFRNHYFVWIDSPVISTLEDLVSVGYMIQGVSRSDGIYYHATEAGMKAIGLHKAAIKRALSCD